MYHKLARGHATQYLSSLNDYSIMRTWAEGGRCRQMVEIFKSSSLSKKPGRVIERVAPLMKPAFVRPAVSCWSKGQKAILAESVTVAKENAVFALPNADVPLYEERSVFLSNLFLAQDGRSVSLSAITIANIGHHALTRLLERDLATPETLHKHVKNMLAQARNIALLTDSGNLNPDENHAFLIPYAGGALPAVTMEVLPDQADNTTRQRVVSIRTFLDETMVTPEQRRRMEGYHKTVETLECRHDTTFMCEWLKANARRRPAAAPDDLAE